MLLDVQNIQHSTPKSEQINRADPNAQLIRQRATYNIRYYQLTFKCWLILRQLTHDVHDPTY